MDKEESTLLVDALTKLSFWEWLGTSTGIIGAGLLASNISASRWGWAVFLLSAIAWTAVGFLRVSKPMIILNLFYVVLNIFGVLRWFNVI